MTKRVSLISGILIILCSSLAWADHPEFEDKGTIKDGGANINVGPDSAPTMADWNNDGAKDLLVGGISGYIRLYLNQGTDLNPVFNGDTQIKSNGAPIKVSGG